MKIGMAPCTSVKGNVVSLLLSEQAIKFNLPKMQHNGRHSLLLYPLVF